MQRVPARLRGLPLRDLALLVQAPVLLPLTALALHRYGLLPVQDFVVRLPGRRPGGKELVARRAEAGRLAWIVQVSAAYGPWPANCLQRSLLLWAVLYRRGLRGNLRIGVRRDRESGTLSFHAWIEHDGLVLNDRRDIRQEYATFDRPVVPRGAHFA
jgi:hypothetical protein